MGPSPSSYGCVLSVASSWGPCHVFSLHGIGWPACGLLWVSRSPQADLLNARLGNLRPPLLPTNHITARFHVPRRQETLMGSSGGKRRFTGDILEDLPRQTVNDVEGTCG